MTTMYQVIYWRDIPAQVKVKAGRNRAGRLLSKRFPVAIDEAAMRAGLTGSDDYLTQWRNGQWLERDGDPDEVLEAIVAELEANYSAERLRLLIEQHGTEEEESN